MTLNEEILAPSMNSFAKKVIDGRYVLIIGSSAILDDKHYEGDSVKMLLDMAISHYYNDDPEELESKLRRTKSFTEWGDYSKAHGAICLANKKVKEMPLKDFVEPSLRDLLDTQMFRVVITTSVDPVIENLMTEVWGGKDKYDVIIGPDDPKVKGDSYYDFSNLNMRERPVLCYLLGKIKDTDDEEYVGAALTEVETLNIMAKWIIESSNPNSFMAEIRNKWLHVSVGCKFEDWMFRFFWYLITGEAGHNLSENEVAVDIEVGNSPNKYNAPLSRYLYGEKLKISFNTSRKFMADAVIKIKEEKNNWKKNNLARLNQKFLFSENAINIFISYAHEDFPYVKMLYDRIVSYNKDGRSDLNISVWMDESDDRGLNAGDSVWKKINNVIQYECDIFIPVLTPTTWLILREKKDKKLGNRFVLQEWEWARESSDLRTKEKMAPLRIIPLTTSRFWDEENREGNKELDVYNYYEKNYLPNSHMSKDVENTFNGSNSVKYVESMDMLIVELLKLIKSSKNE